MRRLLLFAAGLAFLLTIAFPTQHINAQVLGEFDGITVRLNPYSELVDDVPILANKFGMPPNYQQDLDDGYAVIQLDQFGFEFNGEVYNQIWVNINGFITFGKKQSGSLFPPPNLPAGTREPSGLFWEGSSYPVNVIAPFWGDHRYRVDGDKFFGYAPTRISYKSEADRFTIQWKDLNINYRPDYKASVADFQIIIYKSVDPLSSQGNIEFRYGQIGKRPNQEAFFDITDERVITSGASVGLKGEGTIVGQQADFLNGMYNDGRIPFNETFATTLETLTTEWTPSGSGAHSILMVANTRFNVEEWWGDGDVDFSKTAGKAHFQKPQNRFVTINDARLIMRSIATNKPLDPIRRRAAYHADVNHNGRYYFNNSNVKVNVPWRDKNYADNLPTEVSSLKQILFQANEMDAALIIAYISGRVPELPWLLDTFPQYGKVNDNAAALKFGEMIKMNENTYQMPIYLDALYNGALGVKFDIDANVISVVSNEKAGQSVIAMNEFGNPTVVVSANGEFNSNEPVAYVTFSTDNEFVDITSIRHNDKEVANLRLRKENDAAVTGEVMLQNVPNPVANSTNITLNIASAGYYTLAIYDVHGSVIKTIAASNLNANVYNFDWNGLDTNGNKVDNGIYFYRLTGNGETITKKMVVSR